MDQLGIPIRNPPKLECWPRIPNDSLWEVLQMLIPLTGILKVNSKAAWYDDVDCMRQVCMMN